MESLFTRHRSTVVLVAVLSIQLLALAWQVRRPDSEVPLLREWVQAVVSPPQRLVSGAFRAAHEAWINYVDLRGARHQTVRLEEELARQRIQMHQLREQTAELRRLKQTLGFVEASPSRLMVARVIGAGAHDRTRVLFINRGKAHGLHPGLAVITPDGVVGKIQRVLETSAQVLMITDEESGVGVLLERTRVHGVLRGMDSATCQLRYVLNDEHVQVGEKVLTSGEDRIYPKGLPAGVVKTVEAGSDFKKITVQPAAQLSRLEEVLVVIQGQEVELLTPAPASPATHPAGEIPVEGPALPPEGPAVQEATQRPGISRSSRPETDADRIREFYRQRAAEQAAKAGGAQKPAAAPPAPAPQKPPQTP